VRTTLIFAQWLLRQPRFLAGDFSTDFVAEEWHPEQWGAGVEGVAATGTGSGAAPAGLDAEQVAMLAAALAAQESAGQMGKRQVVEEGTGSHWRDAGRRGALGGW
jgi:hypothetical protein